MNKREARAQRAAWQAALLDNRVVRYPTGVLTSYPTHEARDAAIAKARAGGVIAVIAGKARFERKGG